MDNCEHTSIDVKKLADSLRGKLESVYPSSKDRCIYRVPQERRCLNPSDYTPQTVSIGPLHHGKEELKPMEEHKIRYLQHFLRRTKVSIEDFLASVKDKEAKLHNCYAETIQLKSDDFVMMILVDAVFLIEYFLRGCNRNLITPDDHIFGKPWIDIEYDLLLVENQIPLFILDDLFNLAKTATNDDHYQGLSLFTITSSFWEFVLGNFPIEENLLEIKLSEADHFIDLVRLCLPPSQSPTETEFKTKSLPSAMELHQVGVKFRKGSSRSPLHITFNKGILEIPSLEVDDGTERLFRNLIAFEHMHGNTCYLNDYVILVNYLVNAEKDAELLVQNRIFENGLGSSGRLSTVFHSLDKNCFYGDDFQYSGLVKDVQTYCSYSYHKWKAILKQNYFHSPWASISVIAAVILLLLTFIQTACSIIAL